jgi:3-hydroxybutyryl-CoA dehydrogenase
VADRVAVIGAGLMGSGIAQVAAAAGYAVTLQDVSTEALERAVSGISSSYEKFVAKDRMTTAEAAAARGRISTVTELEAAADADLVVEAVFEKLEVKREVFGVLDRVCRPETVLGTNTSAIPVTSIAAATSRPEWVVGTHFFSPVPMMKLCELVRGYQTSDETLDRARAFAEAVGKTCIVVNRDVSGFVTTRLIAALMVEAARLVESGVASAEDVDTACRLGFGHAMGPLATMDLTGVDVMLHAGHNIYDGTGDEKFRPPEVMERMVTAGDLGRKTGRGWYRYDG